MVTNCSFKTTCSKSGGCVIKFGSRISPPACFKACDLLARVEHLEQERAEAIQVLRRVCERLGDNDWPDNLHLVDILSKHLEDHHA